MVASQMANFDNSSKPLVQAAAKGTVKWFNATKGYGFVTMENGGDAFCHASALQPTGHAELPQGAGVVCDLANSERGLQVVTVHSIDMSTAQMQPRRPRHDAGERFGAQNYHDAGANGPMAEGKIKFFNNQKGFGFVMPDNGGNDIYLHASALRRSGVPSVGPDQHVRFCTRQGTKGVEVDRIEIV
jgi:CspA family cold shock protein